MANTAFRPERRIIVNQPASYKGRQIHLRAPPASAQKQDIKTRGAKNKEIIHGRNNGEKTALFTGPHNRRPRSPRTKECAEQTAQTPCNFCTTRSSKRGCYSVPTTTDLLTLLGDILRKGFLISLRPAVIPLRAHHARRTGGQNDSTEMLRFFIGKQREMGQGPWKPTRRRKHTYPPKPQKYQTKNNAPETSTHYKQAANLRKQNEKKKKTCCKRGTQKN